MEHRLISEYRRADRTKRDTMWCMYIGLRAEFQKVEDGAGKDASNMWECPGCGAMFQSRISDSSSQRCTQCVKAEVYERVIDELQDARMMLEIAARGALAILQENRDERSKAVCAALRAALQQKEAT